MLPRDRTVRREDSISGVGLAVTTVVAGLLLVLPALQISYDALRIGGVILAGLLTGALVYARRRGDGAEPRRARPAPYQAPAGPTWSEWLAMAAPRAAWAGRAAN